MMYFDKIFGNIRIDMEIFMITMHVFTLITINETIDHSLNRVSLNRVRSNGFRSIRFRSTGDESFIQ